MTTKVDLNHTDGKLRLCLQILSTGSVLGSRQSVMQSNGAMTPAGHKMLRAALLSSAASSFHRSSTVSGIGDNIGKRLPASAGAAAAAAAAAAGSGRRLGAGAAQDAPSSGTSRTRRKSSGLNYLLNTRTKDPVLLSVLGKGGYGTVYKARWCNSDVRNGAYGLGGWGFCLSFVMLLGGGFIPERLVMVLY